MSFKSMDCYYVSGPPAQEPFSTRNEFVSIDQAGNVLGRIECNPQKGGISGSLQPDEGIADSEFYELFTWVILIMASAFAIKKLRTMLFR